MNNGNDNDNEHYLAVYEHADCMRRHGDHSLKRYLCNTHVTHNARDSNFSIRLEADARDAFQGANNAYRYLSSYMNNSNPNVNREVLELHDNNLQKESMDVVKKLRSLTVPEPSLASSNPRSPDNSISSGDPGPSSNLTSSKIWKPYLSNNNPAFQDNSQSSRFQGHWNSSR